MKVVEREGCTIINDAYNANPLSMIAALDTLHQMKAAQKIAMLGDMLEMGEVEQASHQEVLQHALDLKLDLVLVGPRFKEAWSQLCTITTSNVQCFESSELARRSITLPKRWHCLTQRQSWYEDESILETSPWSHLSWLSVAASVASLQNLPFC